MKNELLFRTRHGDPVRTTDILRAIEQVGAVGAEYLFIHTELSLGTPEPGLSKSSLLESLFATLQEATTGTLCFPTFTFSFCNGTNYDVRNARSRMGALNEYARKRPEAVRSLDPLMSVAAIGKDLSVVTDIGTKSVGPGCTFDLLRRRGSAKFLFIGARPSQCMTYMHYVEERLGVPYRYHRNFTGEVIDQAGLTTTRTYELFVRYNGVFPTSRDDFEQFLLARGDMLRAPCGDGFVFAVPEPIVYDALAEQLATNIDYLLENPYPRDRNDTHFAVQDMVAL